MSKNKSVRREMTNPHDKITVDYSDPEAADAAVCVTGEGRYGVEGEDGMPVFLLGGHDEWCQKKYGCNISALLDRVKGERLLAALESLRVEGHRTSMSDPVGWAHAAAKRLRKAWVDATKHPHTTRSAQ